MHCILTVRRQMKNSNPVTIVLADDHPLFRRGLCDAIQRSTTYAVVGEACDGEEALRMIIELAPRVAILDVEMPKLTGLDVARRVNADGLPVSVIILTMHDEPSLFNLAMDAGVAGYMLKETAVPDILHGLEQVAAGEYYISTALTNLLLQRNRALGTRIERRLNLDRLSPLERRVLRLIAEAQSSSQIAAQLSISLRTVESHRYNICRKLDISGSHALLRFAVENKAVI
ncbi:MAG: response regulator transcription factor [Bacteroidota bacterium]|nr:response regulator transcription factor [Bacteroidota bacterium]